LPADFDLSSKICKIILLLIHHYRGPPSLLGKALKEFDKSKFETLSLQKKKPEGFFFI